jgi:iron(III) transport system permease protein
VITDFGIPKVIGGNFNVLATDVFKLVIGQQDFQRGAVVAMLLLAPAVLTFGVDRWCQPQADRHAHRARRALRGRAARAARPGAHAFCGTWCRAGAGHAGHGGVRRFASFWPYNLAPSLRHYTWAWWTPRWATPSSTACDGRGHRRVRHRAGVHGAYLLEKTAHRRPLRAPWCGCWPRCRWPCRAWCWAWATSSSSTRPQPAGGLYHTMRC